MGPMGPMGPWGPWEPMGPMGTHGDPWGPMGPKGTHGAQGPLGEFLGHWIFFKGKQTKVLVSFSHIMFINFRSPLIVFLSCLMVLAKINYFYFMISDLCNFEKCLRI